MGALSEYEYNLFNLDELLKIEEEGINIINPKDMKKMKNIFLSKPIKTLKFTKENLANIEFANVTDLVSASNGNEAHAKAYASNDYYGYKYSQLHGIYPDMISFRKVKTNLFVEKLFKSINVPDDSYTKSIENENEKIEVESIIIAFKQGDSSLYVFIDYDELYIFYDKQYEKDESGSLQTLIGLIKGCVEPITSKNKIFVVYQSQNGFEKTGFDIKKVNINLDENYNTGFTTVSKEIIKGLNDKNKTNLVMLSGDPGTGKTSYLRYLTSKLTKNIIFISPDMVNHITDPSFIPFLMKNNDSILIIEDAEPAMESRGGGGRSGAVSNILNLTDGLLSDCLNISIIATFNTSSKNIDPALLRKGRLLKNYKFERLSVIKSKTLLTKLGRKNVKVTVPMTLSDIYFEDSDNNSVELKSKKVGF